MKGLKVFFLMAGILVLGLVVVGGIALLNKPAAVVFFIFLLTIFIWLATSWPIVGSKEVAVKVILGEPKSVEKSGYVFVPKLPQSELDRFPTDLFDLDYPVFKVQTKEGDSQDGKPCGSFDVSIDVIGYARFPQDDDLLKVQKANLPKTKEGLTVRTKEWVQTEMRLLASARTWRDLVFNMQEIDEQAKTSFQSRGPLFKVGFKADDLTLGIQEIVLLPELKKVLSEAETAEIEARNQALRSIKTFLEKFGSILISLGLDPSSLVEEIGSLSLEDKTAFVAYVQEFTLNTELAAKAGYFKFEGSDNPTSLQDLIALWKRIGGGSAGQTGEQPSGGGQAGGGQAASTEASGRKSDAEVKKSVERMQEKAEQFLARQKEKEKKKK